MRAYIRLDPRYPEHKEGYPDGALAALTLVFCYAEQQPDRGRFKPNVLKALLGRRRRWIPFLIDHRDLVEQEDGRLYVDGWDEWQEGDWQVTERMRRVRNKNRNSDRNTDRNTDRNADRSPPTPPLGTKAQAQTVSRNAGRNGDPERSPDEGDKSPDGSGPLADAVRAKYGEILARQRGELA